MTGLQAETGNGISKKNFLDQNYKEVGALLMNDSSWVFEIIYYDVPKVQKI